MQAAAITGEVKVLFPPQAATAQAQKKPPLFHGSSVEKWAVPETDSTLLRKIKTVEWRSGAATRLPQTLAGSAAVDAAVFLYHGHESADFARLWAQLVDEKIAAQGRAFGQGQLAALLRGESVGPGGHTLCSAGNRHTTVLPYDSREYSRVIPIVLVPGVKRWLGYAFPSPLGANMSLQKDTRVIVRA